MNHSIDVSKYTCEKRCFLHLLDNKLGIIGAKRFCLSVFFSTNRITL